MATEEKGDGRTVQLRRVRLSFTESLKDKKKTSEDGEPKHTCNLILEAGGKYDEQNRRLVGAAIRAACEKEWKNADAWKGIAEDNPKRICYRKGERFKNRDGVVYDGYAGNMALSCAGPSGGKKRPKLLDRHKREVEEKDILDVFYSGAYADVFVSFYGTDKGGSRGLFASVEAIRSHQEGERLGGGAPSIDADDFDDLDDDDSFDKKPSSSGSDDLDL